MMSPDERKLLDEAVELSRANNQILRKLESARRWVSFLSWLKWIIIIAVTVGSYYYLQPYLDTVAKLYGVLPGGGDITKLLDNLPRQP